MLLPPTFNTLHQMLRHFPDEESCYSYLQKIFWKDGPVSPFDRKSSVYKCATGKYKCRHSNKYFTLLTGTIFEGTKVSLHSWFLAIWFITNTKKGISSHQLSRDIGVTQKTAWFMLQRIRYVLKHKTFKKKMEGIVEADETYVGGKEKNKHWDKKTGDTKGRSTTVKIPVFGLLQKGGEVFAKVVEGTGKKTIEPIITKMVAKGATMMTDEWWAYKELYKRYDHQIVNHGKRQYAEGEKYTNTLKGFWGLFKRCIIGIYHQVSQKHLQRYVDESVFRYNKRKLNNHTRFSQFFELMPGKKITYFNLTWNSNAAS